MKRIFILFFSLSFLAIGLSSCLWAAVLDEKAAKKEFTVENRCIPEDFGRPESCILVVKTGVRSYDKRLERNFSEYRGQYKLITKEELDSDLYRDRQQFRYVFNYRDQVRTRTYFNEERRRQETETVRFKRFYLLDRVKIKEHAFTFVSSYYSRIMKGYIHNLNLKLQEEGVVNVVEE